MTDELFWGWVFLFASIMLVIVVLFLLFMLLDDPSADPHIYSVCEILGDCVDAN